MWWLTALGLVVVLLTLTDMLWTVLASSLGAGPLSRVSAETVWRAVTAGSAGARRRQVAGYVVVIALPFVWFVLFFLGFTAILEGAGQVKVDVDGAPTLLKGFLFAYGVLVALGSNFTTAGSVIQYSAALLGIVWSSLSLTYVMQIVSADTRERSVASGIMALGESPYTILEEALQQRDLGSLPLQIVSLSSTLSTVGQDHLAYPVLKYVMARKKEYSSVIAVARFDEMITLLQGAARDTDPLLVRAGRSAVSDFIRTLRLHESDQQPPGLQVSRLSVPSERLASQSELDDVLHGLHSHRRKLTTLLRRGGAGWDDVYPNT